MSNNIIQTTIDIPEDIILKIYSLKEVTKDTNLRSNVNGWQSPQYTLIDDLPWVETLLKECLQKLNLSNLQLQNFWFNINPNGSFHTWHSHKGTTNVVVCYIQVPKKSGNLELRYNDRIKSIEPYTGLLITFKGGIDHQVLKNQSNEDRITLAFNLESKS